MNDTKVMPFNGVRKMLKEHKGIETYQILDTTLDTAISTLEALRQVAGGDAILDHDICDSYGDYYVDLTLYWERPETDTEYTKRVEQNAKRSATAKRSAAKRKKQEALDELALYEKLKEKYNGKT